MAPRRRHITHRSRSGSRALGDRRSGFTLMELMVAMTLLVILIGMSLPYVGGALGVQVKSAARTLAGTLRYVFDESVMQSSNFRLVFNLDRHTYAVEQCPGGSAILYRSASEREVGEAVLQDKLRQREDSARSDSAPVPLADTALQSCTPSSDPQLAPVTLKEPITLLGVWTAQYPAVVRGNLDGPPEDANEDQIAVVNFVKGGFAERAYIYLSDGGDDVYTLELEPLTGQVFLHNGEYEVPREFWRQQ